MTVPFGRYCGDKNIITFGGDHNSPRPAFFFDSVGIFFHNVLVQNHEPEPVQSERARPITEDAPRSDALRPALAVSGLDAYSAYRQHLGGGGAPQGQGRLVGQQTPGAPNGAGQQGGGGAVRMSPPKEPMPDAWGDSHALQAAFSPFLQGAGDGGEDSVMQALKHSLWEMESELGPNDPNVIELRSMLAEYQKRN